MREREEEKENPKVKALLCMQLILDSRQEALSTLVLGRDSRGSPDYSGGDPEESVTAPQVFTVNAGP